MNRCWKNGASACWIFRCIASDIVETFFRWFKKWVMTRSKSSPSVLKICTCGNISIRASKRLNSMRPKIEKNGYHYSFLEDFFEERRFGFKRL